MHATEIEYHGHGLNLLYDESGDGREISRDFTARYG